MFLMGEGLPKSIKLHTFAFNLVKNANACRFGKCGSIVHVGECVSKRRNQRKNQK